MPSTARAKQEDWGSTISKAGLAVIDAVSLKQAYNELGEIDEDSWFFLAEKHIADMLEQVPEKEADTVCQTIHSHLRDSIHLAHSRTLSTTHSRIAQEGREAISSHGYLNDDELADLKAYAEADRDVFGAIKKSGTWNDDLFENADTKLQEWIDTCIAVIPQTEIKTRQVIHDMGQKGGLYSEEGVEKKEAQKQALRAHNRDEFAAMQEAFQVNGGKRHKQV